jgi:multidrug efflux pump subunit AcrA (membrane-fusion protein)
MNDSTEQQLRREIEELRRQIRAQDEHPHDPHSGSPAQHWRPSGVTISVLLLGLAVLLAVAFFAGYLPLQKRDATVQAEAAQREKALPRMEVMRIGRASGESGITLPGTMQALTEAPLLARADGYLKSRTADIGDHVHTGQTLAEIDAPELDQQIRQAQAAIDQAQAAVEQAQASVEQAQANLTQGKTNLELARVTAERYKTLTVQGVVSKQDNDQFQAQYTSQTANLQALEKAVSAQQSNLAATKANLAASKANLARLQEMHGYLTVKAPFDGIITQRNVDIGALVTTGSTLLFRMAQIGTLRTFINVPQLSANSVHLGQQAHLTLSSSPGRTFHGTVARTANSLDPASRTMLVEIDVPNPDGSLFPGMYADVTLNSTTAEPALVVPASALIVRSDGAQLAAVSPDGIIHLRKVAVGRDYGDRAEILQGIEDGATIVTAPGDSAQEGTQIVPVPAAGSQP